METRHSRAVPGFNGQTFIHTNPLPAVSNLPSFSYGSPQNVLPKQPTLRDTRLRMGDALQQADEAAKKRLEAAAAERKKADEARRAGKEKPADDQVNQSANINADSSQPSTKAVRRTPRSRRTSEAPGTARRSLRSQSVISRATDGHGSDDERTNRSGSEANFDNGDETVNEIHNIISRAHQPHAQPAVLRNRSVNIHRSLSPESSSKPRSAMKGSRDQAQRTPANARAKRDGQTRVEADITYNEEFSGMGHRAHSPFDATKASTRLARIQERFSPGDKNQTDDDMHINDHDEAHASAKLFPRLFNFGREKPHNPSIHQRQDHSWFSGARKKATLFAYFLKHLLRSSLVIGFFAIAVSGGLWLLYDGGYFTRYSGQRNMFKPPQTPPTTYDELYSRLVDVENHLKSWTEFQQSDSAAWKALSDKEKQKRERLEQELASMNEVLAKLSGVSNDFEQHKQAYRSNEYATKTILSEMQASLAALDHSVKGNINELRASRKESTEAKKQLNDIQGKINVVKEDIKKLELAHSLNQKALQTFEDALPRQIAVRVDPKTGKLSVSPELWRHLQSLLRRDMEEYLQKSAPASADRNEAQKPSVNTWDDFLAKNEAKLRGFIGDYEDERWRNAIADGVVISRDQLLKLVETEMSSVRSEFENHNRGLYSQIMTDAKDAAVAIAKQGANSRTAAPASKYGDALIQAALHQYSSAVLLKPDYALAARGTYINPKLTSSTYVVPKGGVSGMISWFGQYEPNSPVHVLQESVNIGNCWTFPKSAGQVSLLFPEMIFPSDVTIDHVPKALLGDARSAPRDMEFWIRVADDEIREQIGRAAAVVLGDDAGSSQSRALTANQFVRVAAFTYDIDSAYPTQTFEIPIDLQKFGVPVVEVSFRVLNNWGNDHYTSLYRVRVHGTAEGKSGAESSN